jgi:hypothetical protein
MPRRDKEINVLIYIAKPCRDIAELPHFQTRIRHCLKWSTRVLPFAWVRRKPQNKKFAEGSLSPNPESKSAATEYEASPVTTKPRLSVKLRNI